MFSAEPGLSPGEFPRGGPQEGDARRVSWRKEGPLRLGIMISGRGSNMQAIVRAIDLGNLDARVAIVVCNHADAPGVAWARARGLRAMVFERQNFPSRDDQNQAMSDAMKQAGVELVTMAGYDRLITGAVFSTFPQRIMNIHPSLLPAFPGTLHAQAQALAHGIKVSGCTVHFVVEGEVDGGPIILQVAVPVLEGDTEESLAARILQQEHLAYPRAVQLFAEGRLRIEERRVRIL